MKKPDPNAPLRKLVRHWDVTPLAYRIRTALGIRWVARPHVQTRDGREGRLVYYERHPGF